MGINGTKLTPLSLSIYQCHNLKDFDEHNNI